MIPCDDFLCAVRATYGSILVPLIICREVVALYLSDGSPILTNPCKKTLCDEIPFLAHNSSTEKGSAASLGLGAEKYLGL